jgi:hypothetical protein
MNLSAGFAVWGLIPLWIFLLVLKLVVQHGCAGLAKGLRSFVLP